eukprot:GHVQ01016697.1.p1 GENE.GHVQ01016697.1~~GHVQ01016697.1.p1  ORF type:complete len:998 (-),score=90.63 GHVQ01016697.1:80-3025(-)
MRHLLFYSSSDVIICITIMILLTSVHQGFEFTSTELHGSLSLTAIILLTVQFGLCLTCYCIIQLAKKPTIEKVIFPTLLALLSVAPRANLGQANAVQYRLDQLVVFRFFFSAVFVFIPTGFPLATLLLLSFMHAAGLFITYGLEIVFTSSSPSASSIATGFSAIILGCVVGLCMYYRIHMLNISFLKAEMDPLTAWVLLPYYCALEATATEAMCYDFNGWDVESGVTKFEGEDFHVKQGGDNQKYRMEFTEGKTPSGATEHQLTSCHYTVSNKAIPEDEAYEVQSTEDVFMYSSPSKTLSLERASSVHSNLSRRFREGHYRTFSNNHIGQLPTHPSRTDYTTALDSLVMFVNNPTSSNLRHAASPRHRLRLPAFAHSDTVDKGPGQLPSSPSEVTTDIPLPFTSVLGRRRPQRSMTSLPSDNSPVLSLFSDDPPVGDPLTRRSSGMYETSCDWRIVSTPRECMRQRSDSANCSSLCRRSFTHRHRRSESLRDPSVLDGSISARGRNVNLDTMGRIQTGFRDTSPDVEGSRQKVAISKSRTKIDMTPMEDRLFSEAANESKRIKDERNPQKTDDTAKTQDGLPCNPRFNELEQRMLNDLRRISRHEILSDLRACRRMDVLGRPAERRRHHHHGMDHNRSADDSYGHCQSFGKIRHLLAPNGRKYVTTRKAVCKPLLWDLIANSKTTTASMQETRGAAYAPRQVRLTDDDIRIGELGRQKRSRRKNRKQQSPWAAIPKWWKSLWEGSVMRLLWFMHKAKVAMDLCAVNDLCEESRRCRFDAIQEERWFLDWVRGVASSEYANILCIWQALACGLNALWVIVTLVWTSNKYPDYSTPVFRNPVIIGRLCAGTLLDIALVIPQFYTTSVDRLHYLNLLSYLTILTRCMLGLIDFGLRVMTNIHDDLPCFGTTLINLASGPVLTRLNGTLLKLLFLVVFVLNNITFFVAGFFSPDGIDGADWSLWFRMNLSYLGTFLVMITMFTRF